MRRSWVTTLAVLASVIAPGLPAAAQDTTGDVSVLLELNQQFYYAGDPFPVRVSVRNDGERKLDNPVKSPLLQSFVIQDTQGRALERTGETAEDEPARPAKLSPGSFYGTVVDLAALYPGLAKVGEYTVTWAADGLRSQTITVKMLPKYDPAKDYTATIETSRGKFEIELMPKVSPIAVKAFIDMANAGFYDGLLFHEVRADRYVVGGDPQFSEEPRFPFLYPAEQSSLPLVVGTVIVKPARPAPPANGPQFIILLRPEPAWTGQVTVLGQVVEGLEVVRGISRAPSTMQSSRPNFKPLNDVTIQRILVTAREPGPEGTSAASPGE